MTTSIPRGWRIFLTSNKLPSLAEMAEEMYRLNVMARHYKRHAITDQIYKLKDRLIKYLYLHGYCVDAKLHAQKRMCRTCDGTGEYWTGEDCFRCDGTGVYSITWLYALRFLVGERHYAWHQLKKLVDYEITLTDSDVGEYREPERSEAILSLEGAFAGCCMVWWGLLWRGVVCDLLLFPATRSFVSHKFLSLWHKKTEEEPF